MNLREVLIPAVLAAFPNRRGVSQPHAPALIFPAACPEVGDLQIDIDGDEVIVFIDCMPEEFTTMSTWSDYPYCAPEMPAADRYRQITDNLIDFLKAMFADRVVFWKTANNREGWAYPFTGTFPDGVSETAEVFVWTRRLR